MEYIKDRQYSIEEIRKIIGEQSPLSERQIEILKDITRDTSDLFRVRMDSCQLGIIWGIQMERSRRKKYYR